MYSTSAMALIKILQGLGLFFRIVDGLIVAYVVMSWIVRPTNSLFRIVSTMLQPIFAPFRPIARKLLEKGLMVDITPILAIFALQILQNLITYLFEMFFL
jgi:YggT family protein